jgi:ribosomal protein L7Ae-like RNA K-turn-binding protein
MNEKRLFGMLGFAMRAGKLVLGTDLVCASMAKGKISLLLILEEASAATKKKLTTKAEFYKISHLTLPLSAEKVGELLGKTYSPVCIGVSDEGFSREISIAAGENNKE